MKVLRNNGEKKEVIRKKENYRIEKEERINAKRTEKHNRI